MKYLILMLLLVSGCDYEFREKMIKNGVKEWATIMNYKINDNIICEFQPAFLESKQYWLCNVKIENDIINLRCLEQNERSGRCIKI